MSSQRIGQGHDPGRPFADLLAPTTDEGQRVAPKGTALLWLINRVVFHPRGFALAIHIDGAGKAEGWSLVGNGSEPWKYVNDAREDENFAIVEAFLAGRRLGMEPGDPGPIGTERKS